MQRVRDRISDSDFSVIDCATNSAMILNMTDEEAESQIRTVLTKVGLLLQIAEAPSPEFATVLVGLIRQKYRAYTPAEILNAFVMNVSGELSDFITKKDSNENTVRRFEHYQRLSVDFVTSVLNHYKLRKVEAFKNFNKFVTSDADKKEVPPPTPKDLFHSLVNFVKEDNRVPDFWDWDSAYLYAEEVGEINIELKEKEKLFAKIQSEVAKEHATKRIAARTNADRKAVDAMLKPKTIKTECRKRMLSKYLQQFIKEN